MLSVCGFPQSSSLSKDLIEYNGHKKLLVVGQDKETILGYIRAIDPKPAGFMVYTSLRGLEGLATQIDYGSGTQHAEYFAKRYPRSILQIGLHLVGDLDHINQAKFDRNLEQFGQWCKHAKVPILLRIGYEFDYPANNYAPKQYAQAFRYIVDSLRKQGVSNVSMVWHCAGIAAKPMQWYPGDDYVDWFGISFFDPNNRDKYASFARLSREHAKPLMIAESTPRGFSVNEGQNSWQNWFVPFFDFIDANDVKIVSYINSRWEKLPMFKGQGWPNARIQDNKFIKAHWRIKISEF